MDCGVEQDYHAHRGGTDSAKLTWRGALPEFVYRQL